MGFELGRTLRVLLVVLAVALTLGYLGIADRSSHRPPAEAHWIATH